MSAGYFALLLHAHLPFSRHPDDPTVMEERWLYEAVAGSYLPLIDVFERLLADGVPYRCTLSLSAPLISMLTDGLLRDRTLAYLNGLIALSDRELDRTRPEPHYQKLALMYRERFTRLRALWLRHEGDLVGAFRMLSERGAIDVITSTATHAFFPLLDENWPAIRAQVHAAADLFEKHFGRPAQGMWIGECGYVPGVDEILREVGVRYFVVDAHAILAADRRPIYGVYAPLYCPSGVAAFGRDTESSEQVWSADDGYPGDPHYRDFYRDIGFDLPPEALGEYGHPSGARLYTGLKYHAITHEKLHDKWVYDPDVARGKIGLHASHFRGELQKQVSRLAGEMDRPPLVTSPYDAELFGHWWFEGPTFLEDVFRQLHWDQSDVETITLADYLERHPTNQCATPSASSWGRGGYSEQWLNETNAWLWPHLHAAAERMVGLARDHSDETDPLVRRALAQAARELLLAQSSDWPFILSTGTTTAYAKRRFEEHLLQFDELHEAVVAGSIDEAALAELEARDNIFPDVDYRLYAT